MLRRSYAQAPRLPDEGMLDLRELFAGPVAPLELELGCARGGFLLERLAAAPAVRMVGLEIQLKAAFLAAEKIVERGCAERCRVFAADARTLLPRLVPRSITRVFAHFPDPWWKKRHTKRRLATAEVAAELVRILEPGGEIFIQTDVEQLAGAFVEALRGEPSLEPWEPPAGADPNPYAARSPRERAALRDGLPIFRLRYRKQDR